MNPQRPQAATEGTCTLCEMFRPLREAPAHRAAMTVSVKHGHTVPAGDLRVTPKTRPQR